MSITTLLDRRGIRRVVHCHADHFEPDAVARTLGTAADIALWLDRCRPAIPTLFVKAPFGYRLDGDLVLRPNSTADVEAGYLRALSALGVGIGLHVHHESWTRNQLLVDKMSEGRAAIHEYVMRTSNPDRDHERLRAMVEASLAWLRETTGRALETWGFVHGCWAFGASDPEICTLEHEVPLLYSLGCRADFSFPAGRRHCDPPWDRPKWVRPAIGARAAEQGDPRDAPANDRLLVWASKIDGWKCGVDTYSLDAKRLTLATDKIERYLAIGPVIDGTAYIKTCGHGMHPHYWQGEPRPTLGAFARELVAACPVPVEFKTTEQVVAELM